MCFIIQRHRLLSLRLLVWKFCPGFDDYIFRLITFKHSVSSSFIPALSYDSQILSVTNDVYFKLFCWGAIGKETNQMNIAKRSVFTHCWSHFSSLLSIITVSTIRTCCGKAWLILALLIFILLWCIFVFIQRILRKFHGFIYKVNKKWHLFIEFLNIVKFSSGLLSTETEI